MLVGFSKLREGQIKTAEPSFIDIGKKKDLDFDVEYDKQYLKISQKQDPKRWFPDYWLTFLLLGLGASNNSRTVLGAGNKY